VSCGIVHSTIKQKGTQKGHDMTFIDAKKKLKVLADGEYHSIKYGISEYDNGEIEVKCSVYISGYDIHIAPTWVKALDLINAEITSRL